MAVMQGRRKFVDVAAPTVVFPVGRPVAQAPSAKLLFHVRFANVVMLDQESTLPSDPEMTAALKNATIRSFETAVIVPVVTAAEVSEST